MIENDWFWAEAAVIGGAVAAFASILLSGKRQATHSASARTRIAALVRKARKADAPTREILEQRITTAAQEITPALDLEEEADSLIAQLRDLDEQRDRLDQASYETLRSDLRTRAADRLRQRDALLSGLMPNEKENTQPHKPKGPSEDKNAPTSQMAGFFWGAGTVAVVAILYISIQQFSSPRADNGSMNNVSADAPSENTDTLPQELMTPEMLQLVQRLQKDRNDLDALLQVAHRLLRAQQMEEANTLTVQALALDPKNPEGLVHQALIQAAQGDPQGAMQALDHIVENYPTLAEGWFFRGMMSMQNQEPEKMRQSWVRYLEVAPEGPQKERVRTMLKSMP